MELSNLAASALFDLLSRQGLDQKLLLEGTHLKLNDMLNVKKKHAWIEFVKMYENAASLFGAERTAREIAYQGLYNKNLSTLRKIGTGMLNARSLYWFLGTVACRHLFKDTVKFSYQKISANQVRMEISISPELEDCPLLLETYTYLFENVPTTIGLPKAKVTAEISKNKAVYTVELVKTSYFFYILSKFRRSLTGYTSAVLLMEELETQSLQLTKLLDEKSELLRIMSHDISNIAAVIDMSLVQVLRKTNLPEEDRQIITKAKKSSDRLCDLLRNVQKLEVAHLRGVTLGSVNIDEVFSACEDYFSDQLKAKNITWVVQNNLPPLVQITAERSSLEVSVLANLIGNAIKFSNEGSFISLLAGLENGRVVISVADNGKGMSPEERKNLFVKKIRKSTVGTHGEVGTGLGLGIVNTYVQSYGGTIAVEPNFPTGTIIKITLPIFLPPFVDPRLLIASDNSHLTNLN